MPGQSGGRPLSAHEELRALLQRYARAADDRDVETLAALFHPEAEITGSRGVLSLEQWLDTMRAPRAFPTSMHMIADPLIELRGTDRAHLDAYAVVHQLTEASSGGADLTLGIRYLDDVVVHQGSWVIRRRVAHTLWVR